MMPASDIKQNLRSSITGDHGMGTTGDHGRRQETTGDHARPLETMGDHGAEFRRTNFGPSREFSPLPTPPGPLKLLLFAE